MQASRFVFCFVLLISLSSSLPAQVGGASPAVIDLPDGKSLPNSTPPALRVNSFPVALVASPDGRYVVSLNNGFGTLGSNSRQSLAVLDLITNQVVDYPDARLGSKAKQSYFLGMVFNTDGSRLFVSMSSISDPEGRQAGDTGNGIAVYSFDAGKLTPHAFLRIPLQAPAPGKTAALLNRDIGERLIPYPAGLAFIPGDSPDADRLLVADNLSDDALLLKASTGEVIRRFDLATEKVIPGAYPYAVTATQDGKRAFVSLWNSSRVAELNLDHGEVTRFISLSKPQSATVGGSHPTALLLSGDEKMLYVALSNRDSIAVVETATGKVMKNLSTRLPGQRYLGGYPVSLSLDATGKRLFVANSGTDSVAVFDLGATSTPLVNELHKKTSAQIVSRTTSLKPLAFLPTEWYPQAVLVVGNELVVANGKAQGMGPNAGWVTTAQGTKRHPYILSMANGSLTRIKLREANLRTATQQVLANNHLDRKSRYVFPPGKSPIKHVIYIIKENRTYDQVLGDLTGANGDPSLVMYGENITPNQHKLAREFGILDNFYDSGAVSGEGHNWSTAATSSDYLEKTIQIDYRGEERTYDYEGEVAHRYPVEDDMPDVNEPGSGYLWSNLARHRISYRHYGEFVSTRWCNRDWMAESPRDGSPTPKGLSCPKTNIKQGESLPSNVGDPHGSPSPWPWPIPIIAKNTPTKPELRGHFDPKFPDFNLEYPDQLRADEFLNEFAQFVKGRRTGKGKTLPQFVLLRLGNDHTSGTKKGLATPAAAVADNDLAVGRVVDALSHSPYWDDTAVLILEDDAQDGPDHVDAHRSTAFVISKYSPSSAQKPVVDSQFYTTVSMIRTIESLLGLPPMNNNDANALPIASLFRGNGKHEGFTADFRNLRNRSIYQMNSEKSPGAAASAEMDFTHADRADPEKLNAILWRDRMGDKPMPDVKSTPQPH